MKKNIFAIGAQAAPTSSANGQDPVPRCPAEGPGSWGPDVGPFAPAKTGPKPAPEARSVDVPYWRLYVS
jgi:hypothetical protein